MSASSWSSRSPRASLVAVPRDGMRSPRISREIVERSTPDCCASCRCDIFLALSCARSHSLNARPFWSSFVAWALRGSRVRCGDPGVSGWVRCRSRITRSYWRGRFDRAAAARSGGVACGRGHDPVRVAILPPRVRPATARTSRCTAATRAHPRKSSFEAAGERGPPRSAARRRTPARLRRDHVDDRADDDDREHADQRGRPGRWSPPPGRHARRRASARRPPRPRRSRGPPG